MSLLPSRPEAEPSDDAGPRVVGVDEEAADDVLSALSSGTARRILAKLHDDPAPPSELADEVDTSLQNVQYHLDKLQSCGAVEVVETAYSAKGREMDVFAPADQPLVVFAGGNEAKSSLREALSRLLGAVALLTVASLAVQVLIDGLPVLGGDGGDGGGVPAATPTPDGPSIMSGGDGGATPTAAPQLTEEAVRMTTDGAVGLPPGLVFFAGGLFVLMAVAAIWYVR